MYIPPAFKADPQAAERFLAERGYGTLVAEGEDGPFAAHVPFLFARDPEGLATIELHVARANPIHRLVAARPKVLVIAQGPDAYVSADWYASDNQVPTWNYVAVHARGRARLMPPSDFPAHLDRLSDANESRLPKAPWTRAGLDPGRLAALLNAIVGIVVEVETVQGQWKLGQHKGAADHAGATSGLRALGEAGAARVADLMDAAR